MKNPKLKCIVALLMVLLCLNGCMPRKTQSDSDAGVKQEEQIANQDLHHAKAELQNACFDLLEANEQMYAGIFRCLEYTEDYVQTGSWDNLLKARASASAALVELRQMELPAFELTGETMDLLEEAGIEVNAVQREFEILEDTRMSKEDTAVLLCYTLEDDIFLKASAEEALPAMTNFYRDYFTLEYRYMSLFANYMLVQMDAGDLWDSWKGQLPVMAACSEEWYQETTEVEKATDQVLDEMQTLQTQMGEFLGISEFTLEIVQDAAETGNLDVLRGEINQISGVPGYFPIPQWLPDVVNLYLVTDPDTQELRLVNSGEDLNSVPSACYISCGTVSRDDVESYETYLGLWGIETDAGWNETKDTWQMIAESGSSTMMIEWTENETLLYLMEPVGCLIPELYLRAMLAE